MRELFEAIDNCEAGCVNMVLTELDGEYLGEKALVSDGKLVWKINIQIDINSSFLCGGN